MTVEFKYKQNTLLDQLWIHHHTDQDKAGIGDE